MTDSPLRLMLVDEDPVFRLGLRIWLEQSAGYRVIAEANSASDTLAILTARATLDPTSPWTEMDDDRLSQSAVRRPQPDVDLVILDLGLGVGEPSQLPGLQLCAEIKARFPELPVLVLSAQAEAVLVAAARQLGADGFGRRGMPVADLGRLIEQLTLPKGAQRADRLAMAQPASPRGPRSITPLRRSPPVAGPPPTMVDRPTSGSTEPVVQVIGPWTALRRNLRRSSVQQIEVAMAAIEAEQRRGRSDLWSEAILAGRYRELRAARWLMTKLLATPQVMEPEVPSPGGAPTPVRPSSTPGRPAAGATRQPAANRPRAGFGLPGDRSGSPLTPPGGGDDNAPLALPPGDVVGLVFEGVFSKLQGCLDNTSTIPLETDILRDDRKRELLYLALRKFEVALDGLRQTQVPPGQLAEKSPWVLQDVWEATLSDFFGRYYTLRVADVEQPVVPTLIAEAEVVQRSILNRIPLVPMLLSHLLYEEGMVVDGGLYPAQAPAALERSQALLEHLLIQVANGVIQPLLNCFADVELMKKNLYHRRMMTSRDIERFRNDLSWRYRWDGLIQEPTAIFGSEYRLFGFTERGIQAQAIYAPRREELDQLSGLQRVVALTIEARDAIAPRFRAAVALVGSGIVYVLTDVVGRGIGLIGRGILRGVGNAWRDPRYRDPRQRESGPWSDRPDETPDP